MENVKVPISFMTLGFHGVDLIYLDIDKHTIFLYKVVKHFRPYPLKTHIKNVVPHPPIRNHFVHKYLKEKQENWITTLQENYLEIKPSKIVHGQGLCKLSEKSQVSQVIRMKVGIMNMR